MDHSNIGVPEDTVFKEACGNRFGDSHTFGQSTGSARGKCEIAVGEIMPAARDIQPVRVACPWHHMGKEG